MRNQVEIKKKKKKEYFLSLHCTLGTASHFTVSRGLLERCSVWATPAIPTTLFTDEEMKIRDLEQLAQVFIFS